MYAFYFKKKLRCSSIIRLSESIILHPSLGFITGIIHLESVTAGSSNRIQDRDAKLQWAKKSKVASGAVTPTSHKPGCSKNQGDVSQCYPLMGDKYVPHSIVQTGTEEANESRAMLPKSGRPISSISEDIITCSRAPSIMSRQSNKIKITNPDYHYDNPKFKGGCVISGSRLDLLIRKMTFTAIMGILVCLLQMYGVLGPHGLSAAKGKPAIVPWFCYQTFYRLLEFLMGCVMASITRQSFHMNCYPPFSVGAKYRESLFT